MKKIIATQTNEKKIFLSPDQLTMAKGLRESINGALKDAKAGEDYTVPKKLKTEIKRLDAGIQEGIWTAPGLDDRGQHTPCARELQKDLEKTEMDPGQVMVCFRDKGSLLDYKAVDRTVDRSDILKARISHFGLKDAATDELSFEDLDEEMFGQIVAYLQHGSVPKKGIYTHLYIAARTLFLDEFANELFDDIKRKGLGVETAKALFGLGETQEFTNTDLNNNSDWTDIPEELKALAIETLQKSPLGVKEFFEELTGKESILFHDIDLTQDDGVRIKTCCALLSVKGVKSVLSKISPTEVEDLKAELNLIFGEAGIRLIDEDNEINRNGVLVNLDIAQQIALIIYLVEKHPNASPELKEVIGLYNLRASRAVCTKLNDTGLKKDQRDGGKEVWWFWTGEKWVNGQGEEAYPEPDIISINHFSKEEKAISQTDRFCNRDILYDGWLGFTPDFHNGYGAMVVAGLSPSAL